MAKSQYFVVKRRDGWKFMHHGRNSVMFPTRKVAIASALIQSRADESPQILVEGENMAFREKWNSENDV